MGKNDIKNNWFILCNRIIRENTKTKIIHKNKLKEENQ